MCVCVCVCVCVKILKKKKSKLGQKAPKSHWERGRISAPEDTKKKIPGLYTVVENPLVGSLLKNFIFGKYLMSFCHSVKHIKINLASIGIQQYCSYYILSRKQILTGSRRRSTFCSCLLVKVRHIILYN